MENKLNVCCPICNHQFDIEIEDVMAANVEKKISEEFVERLKIAEEKIKSELSLELDKKDEQLKELRKVELDKIQLVKQMKDLKEQAEVDLALAVELKLQEREAEIKLSAEKFANDKAAITLSEKERELKKKTDEFELLLAQKSMEASNKARSEEQMKNAELQKQLDDQKVLVEEMRRKGAQVSMQLQGEVQEVAIEEYLLGTFLMDEIEEIKKGARGADCLQIVNTRAQKRCGTIYYESKRTKDFKKEWIEKFKVDMRLKGATFGVLVTEVMPKNMLRFGLMEGIWICTFEDFKGLSLVLRETVIKLSEVQLAQENKGEKVTILYDYLAGNEFRSHVEAIVESFVQMQTDLDAEKRALNGIWNKRQKQIEKVSMNTINMHSSIKGIVGNSILSIKALELPDVAEDSNTDSLNLIE
jgi:hypothetical protein